MLVPKFSLRFLLILTAAFAVLSLILSQAVRGETGLAIGCLLGLGTVAVAFTLYAWAFCAAWFVAWTVRSIFGPFKGSEVRSPFADAGPPRQIIAPVDPE